MAAAIRVLLLADSHLGLDLAARPRVVRRRRGLDFLANHTSALATALPEAVDVVVHGGDVFDYPDAPVDLAYRAYQPLLRVAERGVPVFVVPGNHERGRLPHAHLLGHPLVHVFNRPRTCTLEVRGRRLSLAGFPYERRGVRTSFPELLERTGWRGQPADTRLLCVHHCVEGATVGPGDFTFRSAADVIRCADLPREFAAVLSGHIHRQQVLTRDLRGAPLPTPVLYPGSVERTSTAELGEPKGFMLVTLDAAGRVSWEVRSLPARPMLVEQLDVRAVRGARLERAVRALIDASPADAVLRICVVGEPDPASRRLLSAARLRKYAPETMNVEVRTAGGGAFVRSAFVPGRRTAGEPTPGGNFRLDL